MTPADTTCALLTPEHVRFQYRLAGLASRAWAFGADTLLKLMILAVAAMILKTLLGEFGTGLVVLTAFLLEWFYFIAFEILMNGQTPGKRMLRLRVISSDGTPLKWQQCVLRNLLRPADQFPLLYTVGGLCMFLTDDCQRLGDLAAGTLVVRDDETTMPSLPRIDREQTETLMSCIPRALGFHQDLRQTIFVYTAKRQYLSRALRLELIRPVLPVILERTGLPSDTDPDHLMCACYRVMTGDQ